MNKKLLLVALLPSFLLSSCGSSGFKEDSEANVKSIASKYSIEAIKEKYNEFATIDITYNVNKAEGEVFTYLADYFIDVFVMLEGFKPDQNFKVGEEVKSVKRQFSYNSHYIINSDNLLLSSLIKATEYFGTLNNCKYYSADTKVGIKGDINLETTGVKPNVDITTFTLEMYSNEEGLINDTKFVVEMKDGQNSLSAEATHKFNWKLKI